MGDDMDNPFDLFESLYPTKKCRRGRKLKRGEEDIFPDGKIPTWEEFMNTPPDPTCDNDNFERACNTPRVSIPLDPVLRSQLLDAALAEIYGDSPSPYAYMSAYPLNDRLHILKWSDTEEEEEETKPKTTVRKVYRKPSTRNKAANSADNQNLKLKPGKGVTPLKGIVCFIDVSCKEGDHLTKDDIQKKLLELGAKVESKFTGKVTHLVFRNGLESTLEAAKKKKNVLIVSPDWVEETEKNVYQAGIASFHPKNLPRKKLDFDSCKETPAEGELDLTASIRKALSTVKRGTNNSSETKLDTPAQKAPKELQPKKRKYTKRTKKGDNEDTFQFEPQPSTSKILKLSK